MGNALNYVCPQCGDPDHIDMCAFVTVRLTSSGARIIENEADLGADCWSAENGAGCATCGYEGVVKDFAASFEEDAEALAHATIKRLEADPGDKLAAALARLGRALRATPQVVSLAEFRRRRD